MAVWLLSAFILHIVRSKISKQKSKGNQKKFQGLEVICWRMRSTDSVFLDPFTRREKYWKDYVNQPEQKWNKDSDMGRMFGFQSWDDL